MGSPDQFSGRLPAHFMTPGSSSFSDFLSVHAPDMLPSARVLPVDATVSVPHGTTIVALRTPNGVVMAGDRRATMGNVIAQRDIEKVFAADEYSCVGIAGSAGIAIELVRLFQVELEHYEKIEGVLLSLEGKANRLASMLRANLGLAMQGLAAVPVFAGYDLEDSMGRIFTYDVTGGRYEEQDFATIGSGSPFARGALKKTWRPDLTLDDAIRVSIEALYDAADDDSATGGPDLTRMIYPIVAVVDENGFRRVRDAEMTPIVQAMIARRTEQPGGGV